MPEEIMIIVVMAIIFGSVTSTIRMILSHKEKTMGLRKAGRSSESSSMTSSELERMLHRAVRKATDPISDRLDELEDRLELTAARPAESARIELDDEYGAREPAMAPQRNRAR